MTVKAILARKGRNVVGIEPDASLADAARMLSKHRIGAVIVKREGDRIGGLLSERDIVEAVAKHGAAALEMRVEETMVRRVVTCVEADSVCVLMEQMTTGKFRHLPVVEDGSLIGIVSIGDVVKSRLEEMEAESNAMREYIATA